MFSTHIEHHLNVTCRRICALPQVQQPSSGKKAGSSDDSDDGSSDNDSYNDSDDGSGAGKKLQMLVGSCYVPNVDLGEGNRRGDNILMKVEYDEDAHEVYETGVYNHSAGEVWSMATPSITSSSSSSSSSNNNNHLVATCGSLSAAEMQVTVWKMPQSTGDDDDPSSSDAPYYDDEDGMVPRMDLKLQHVLAVDNGDNSVDRELSARKTTLKWSPHSSHSSGQMLTVNTSCLQTFDIETGEELFHASVEPFFEPPTFACPLDIVPCVHDAHDVNRVCVAVGNGLHFWDVREHTGKPAQVFQNLHRHAILDVDVNPHRPHTYVTTGQEAQMKIWDLRKIVPPLSDEMCQKYGIRPLEEKKESDPYFSVEEQFLMPIKVVKGGHTHWISTVKYNPFHDQLVVSGGTDTWVNLWRLSSVSSAPILEMEDNEDGEEADVDEFGVQPGTFQDDEQEEKNPNKNDEEQEEGVRLTKKHIGPAYGTKKTLEDFMKPFAKYGTLEDFDKPKPDPATASASDESPLSPMAHQPSSVGVAGNNTKSANPAAADKRIIEFECQESVYEVAWLDAWTYASVTYDGQLVVNQVPSQEKYKILL